MKALSSRVLSVMSMAWLAMSTLPCLAGEIEGVVTEAFSQALGRPEYISGVRVKAKLANGTEVDAEGLTTDSQGRYLITKLPVETVEVSFSCVGFVDNPTRRSVVIKDDKPVTLNVELSQQEASGEFYAKLLRIASEEAAKAPSTNGYDIVYRKMWVGLHRSNVPVVQKSQFARYLVEKDHQSLEAIPGLSFYAATNIGALKEATRAAEVAFKEGNAGKVSEVKVIHALPPQLYADLITQIALSTNPADAGEIVERASKSGTNAQKKAARELLTVKSKLGSGERMEFDKIIRPD